MLPAKIHLKRSHLWGRSRRTADSTINSQKPDIYIYLNNSIIPASREKLSECQIVLSECPTHKKIFLVTETLEPTMFTKVIDLLHGSTLDLTNMKELANFLDIIDYLHDAPLIEEIQQHIEKDIQSYDIFCLLELAYNFGLQRIFELCICYLELDGFEQIKYNKFDFLELNFTLFQIVLRKHHLLKIKGKIEGLAPPDIEEVIKLYCNRKKLDNSIILRLLEKYVISLEELNPVKNSLRLEKLAHKNIMQSANIETESYENEKDEKEIDDNFVISSYRRSSSMKLNQYSYDVIKESTNTNTNTNTKTKNLNLGNKSFNFRGIEEQNDNESVTLGDEHYNKDYEINIMKVLEDQHLLDSPIPKSDDMEINFHTYIKETHPKTTLLVSEPEFLASKISTLLGEYEEAFKAHETNFENMRKNARSSQFLDSNNINESKDLYESSELLNNNPNLAFTIYLPGE